MGSPFGKNSLLNKLLEQKEKNLNYKSSIQDSAGMISTILTGQIAFDRNFDEKKLRESLFARELLRGLGKNVGMIQNTSASSDALNYGPLFWQINSYSKDIDEAKAEVDDKMLELLENCRKEQKHIDILISNNENKSKFAELTTQDCLMRQLYMSSSVMDCTPWHANVKNLGLYDIAAIKFAYAQLVEVFDKDALQIDQNKISLREWLFLNDWKKIPKELFKNKNAIHKREHIKYSWDKNTTTFSPSPYEIPYRFCDDESGQKAPYCNAFDAGPDMRTRAKRLQDKYWQNYYSTHFSQGKIWPFWKGEQNAFEYNASIMLEFNNIMRWYYYLEADYPGFHGSDAQRDFLAAAGMGLNHYSHVLGHPEPGLYVNVPNYKIEDDVQFGNDMNRLDISKCMIKVEDLDNECEKKHAGISKTENGSSNLHKGFVLAKVSLGDGRLFSSKLTSHYDDWYLDQISSTKSKSLALQLLSDPGIWLPPKVDSLKDRRHFTVNWQKLFPVQVNRLFYDIILGNNERLGPIIDEEGNLTHRNLIDIKTMQSPNYEGNYFIIPKMSSYVPYHAAIFASLFMSDDNMESFNIMKSMHLYVKGDKGKFESADSENVTTFTTDSAEQYAAVKIDEDDFSIGYDFLEKMNYFQEKIDTIASCLQNETSLTVSPQICQCIVSTINGRCIPPSLRSLSDESCDESDLAIHKKKLEGRLKVMSSFADDIRNIVNILGK